MHTKNYPRLATARQRKTTRNFGIGTRDLLRAGKLWSHASAKAFATRGTLAERWTVFANWLRATQRITKMEAVMPEHLIQYGDHLKARINQGDLRPSTAQLYVSAVNTVMKLATQGEWRSVSPTRDCGIPRRNYLPEHSRAMLAFQHDTLVARVDERIGTLLNLQRTLGLRFKESALLDARRTLRQAVREGRVTVSSGTKGGRQREIPVSSEALKALEAAAVIQHGRSLVPDDDRSYVDFRSECYALAQKHGFNFHAERHHYAQQRYQALTGVPAPVTTDVPRRDWLEFMAEFLQVEASAAEAIDREARQILSKELGHNRPEVTNVYIG
jgi:site-specific recombinase XerD